MDPKRQFGEAMASMGNEQKTLDERNAQLAQAQEKFDVDRERAVQDVRVRMQKILDEQSSSQRIRLKDFILQLQEDLARGGKRIGTELGRDYGLDNVDMEVKMIPGVGGVGLHLPDVDQPVDPDRLSTLKLRFTAVAAEDEKKTQWAQVPFLEGATEGFALRALSQAGFGTDLVYQEVEDEALHGRVLALLFAPGPGAGNQARLESTVTLVIGQHRSQPALQYGVMAER